VLDANGQSLAYVYGRETKADADIAHVLTMMRLGASPATLRSCRLFYRRNLSMNEKSLA
jgi:hypothetical protein